MSSRSRSPPPATATAAAAAATAAASATTATTARHAAALRARLHRLRRLPACAAAVVLGARRAVAHALERIVPAAAASCTPAPLLHRARRADCAAPTARAAFEAAGAPAAAVESLATRLLLEVAAVRVAE